MSDFETAHQLEQAKASDEGIPAELAFEGVIKNRVSPVSSMLSIELAPRANNAAALLIKRLYGLPLLRGAQCRVVTVLPLVLRLCRAMERALAQTKSPVTTVGSRQSNRAQIEVYHVQSQEGEK